MNPLLFGSRERTLFGIHSPAGTNRQRRGVVICPPWGAEYQRAHRACRLLGERMHAQGWDVMRFDYYGTGDSGGTAEDVTFSGCVDDTIAAIDELRALADLRRVGLVGLRLGAAIAYHAAARSRAVDRVTLWDPVVHGREYLAEIGVDGAGRVGGYAMSEGLRTGIAALEPATLPEVAARVLVVCTEPHARHEELARHLEGAAPAIEYALRPGPTAWTEEAALGVGAIPVDALAHIVEWGQSE